MQTHARVIVIGGGAVGCSALYHLTQLGVADAVLLERDELTAGSTWHAAGNCPNFSTSRNVIKLQRHSTRLYAELGARVGYDINDSWNAYLGVDNLADVIPPLGLTGTGEGSGIYDVRARYFYAGVKVNF